MFRKNFKESSIEELREAKSEYENYRYGTKGYFYWEAIRQEIERREKYEKLANKVSSFAERLAAAI